MSNRNTGVSNGQLMSRNVLELSGERDSERRQSAINELYTKKILDRDARDGSTNRPEPCNGLIPERELGAFGRLPTRDLTSLPHLEMAWLSAFQQF
jgi:hypothetical protein